MQFLCFVCWYDLEKWNKTRGNFQKLFSAATDLCIYALVSGQKICFSVMTKGVLWMRVHLGNYLKLLYVIS